MKTYFAHSIFTTASLIILGACTNAADSSEAIEVGQQAASSIGEAINAPADILRANLTMPDFGGEAVNSDQPPNFIIMIGDDMGQETLNCYDVGELQAHTPNLDKLCNNGMRFDNFWSQPVCSPTRATLLSGLYGFKNGIGAPLGPPQGIDWNIPGGPVDDSPANGMAAGMTGGMAAGMAAGMATGMGGGSPDLSAPLVRETPLTDGAPAPQAPTENLVTGLRSDIYSLITALKSDSSKNYQTALVGKWHLAGTENGALKHPLNMGFDYQSGPMRGGGVAYYDAYSKSINGGDPFGVESYVTSDTVDDGIAWVASLKDSSDPFLLWTAFNAPHTPFHMPPAELLASDLKNLTQETSSANQQYHAMLEAMDTEIGRLIASLDPDVLANSYILFMGDNGTPGQSNPTIPYGRTKSKGSLYQGGINVPFFISGPGIEKGSVTKSLANSVDIYKTILDLAGVNDPRANQEAEDSVSLKPILHEDKNGDVRDFVFADLFGMAGPNQRNARTISNGHYKLLQNILANTEELFDLHQDPYENVNLLQGNLTPEQEENYKALKSQLAGLVNG